jgi:hypothetical protein
MVCFAATPREDSEILEKVVTALPGYGKRKVCPTFSGISFD